MKAEVKITDVGPFRGDRTFTLDSSKINVVEAPNASGKSSVIKAMAALLGLPAKSHLENDVAKRLGLVQLNPEDRNPLVNLESQKAVVRLTVDGNSRELSVPLFGLPKVAPPGDYRFLLTGILLRESEIVRRLDEGSDDFSWLVSSLSLSSKYEECKRILNEYSITARDFLGKLLTGQMVIKNSQEELSRLKEKREKIRKARAELEAKLTKVLSPDPKITKEISELTKQRDAIEDEIHKSIATLSDAQASKEKSESDVKYWTNQLSQLQKEVDRIEKKLSELPSESDVLKANKEAREIREVTIPELRQEIGKFTAEVGLFEQAEKWIKPHAQSIPCPLCTEVGASPIGSIPVSNFVSRLRKAREGQRDVQSKLARAIQRAEELEALGQDTATQRKELISRMSDVNGKYESAKGGLRQAERDLETRARTAEASQEQLVAQQKTLARIRSQLEELNSKYGGEQRSHLVKELQGIESELGGIENQITSLESTISNKSNVEVAGQVLQVDRAVEVYEHWLNILTELGLYVDEVIMQQRRGAAKSFNAGVTKVLEEMEFGGLKAWIDESSYRLKVQRGGRSGFADQAISSLSTSERHALAAVLTLAAKEAYAADIPFFLVDEVLLDFDKKRLDAFVDYLKEAAVKKGEFVLVSRLGGHELNVRTTEVL